MHKNADLKVPLSGIRWQVMVRISNKRKRSHKAGSPVTIKGAVNSTNSESIECSHIGYNRPRDDEIENPFIKVCSVRDDLERTSRQTSLLTFFAKGTTSKPRKITRNANEVNSTSMSSIKNDNTNRTLSFSRRSISTSSSSPNHLTTKSLPRERKKVSPSSTCHSKSQFHQSKSKPLTQVYIDCGQSKFGQILCKMCGMLYMSGISEDENQHKRLCQAYTLGIPCNRNNVKGGKQVDVLTNANCNSCIDDGVIVLWRPWITSRNSKNSKKAKFEEKTLKRVSYDEDRPSQWPLLSRMIAKDLGTDEDTTLDHLTNNIVLLYIGKYSKDNEKEGTRDRILGVATVQVLGEVHAYRMISLYERARTPVTEAKLGIGLLWTHLIARNRGIATKLVHAAREHAIFGMKVQRQEVAFSNPTRAGYNFALRYSKSVAFKNGVEIQNSNKATCNDSDDREQNPQNDLINAGKKGKQVFSLSSRNGGPLVYEMNL